MKTRLTAPARHQANRIDEWWRENRDAAPDLFVQELAEARRVIAATPELGTPYAERGGTIIRRILLPKTKNHLYFEIDRASGTVMILAIWGGPKSRGPKL